ncbi:MAG: hypothetical protein HON47_04280 [Candidatus Diapherotrites archaeon]|uniref:Uncharacterized protein n=1 Tax=Candidatus Iainarchaeum sp. TaxID=3101447 RepID=A0A8T5GGY6_9ARCH|nr:hypothetical protein [Candidatus Diapherotrites archaeon]
MITTSKGLIFSMDALVAFIIVLSMLLIFVLTINNNGNNLTQNVGHFFLEEKVMLIADSLVKNHNEENNLLGSATIDLEKKRVKSNELNLANFNNLKSIKQDDFFIKSVSYKTNFKKEKWIIENKIGECLIVKRFALIDGVKGIIFVEGCK